MRAMGPFGMTWWRCMSDLADRGSGVVSCFGCLFGCLSVDCLSMSAWIDYV